MWDSEKRRDKQDVPSVGTGEAGRGVALALESGVIQESTSSSVDLTRDWDQLPASPSSSWIPASGMVGLRVLGDMPSDDMTMPMRPHIHPPAIAISVVVPSDKMTMPPAPMGNRCRLLARRLDGDLGGGGPLVLGRRLGHDSRECQQDEARQRDEHGLHR